MNQINHRNYIAFLIIFLFLNIKLIATNTFNIMEYGAKNDTNIVSTKQIQAAVDDCAKQGGGQIYFPPGNYTSGSIVLKKNVGIYLEAGATLFASRDTLDYSVSQDNSGDVIPVLIYAKGVNNISITGKGVINGRAQHIKGLPVKVDNFICNITENAQKSGVDMKRWFHVKPFVCLVYLENCNFVTVRDITLRESQFWTLHARWSDHLFIDNVFIYSSLDRGINADGLDIDGCRNVVISNSIIETGDDAIVLKTTLMKGESRSCENVTVTNCILSSSSAALKLGTESHADFRYITFTNCVIRNSNRGLSIIIRDGASAENIQFSNIQIECNRRHYNWWGNGDPFWLVVLKRNADSKVGTIRNVSFSNITALARGTSKIEGFQNAPLENIHFDNVKIKMMSEDYTDKRCHDAFQAHDVRNLNLNNFTINWDKSQTEPKWRDTFSFYNIDRLNLQQVNGEVSLNQNSCFIRLDKVNNATLQNIRSDAPKTNIIKKVNCNTILVQ